MALLHANTNTKFQSWSFIRRLHIFRLLPIGMLMLGILNIWIAGITHSSWSSSSGNIATTTDTVGPTRQHPEKSQQQQQQQQPPPPPPPPRNKQVQKPSDQEQLKLDNLSTSMKHPSKSSQQKRHDDESNQHNFETKTKNTNQSITTNGNQDRHHEPTHHVIFSTSCSSRQDWQSYLFFYHAMIQEQPGTVTRIVSGCTPAEQVALQTIFEDQILPMTTNRTSFHIHFTPEFSLKGIRAKIWIETKYWNKPFGVQHWMEHVLGYKYISKTKRTLDTPYIVSSSVAAGKEYKQTAHSYTFASYGSNIHDEDIVILVDPDMFLTRPLVNNFSSVPVTTWIPHYKTIPISQVATKATLGHALAQHYNYDHVWLTTIQSNLSFVLGNVDESPLYSNNTTFKDAARYYPAGPPYIVTAYDMYRISVWWTEFVPRIFAIFPDMMAEMFGYSTAAAHLQIPHQLAQGFMVSEPGARLEGWEFLKSSTIQPNDICARTTIRPPIPPSVRLTNNGGGDDDTARIQNWNIANQRYQSVTFPNEPFVIHYCQRYSIGEYFYSKYKSHHEILACDSPLMDIPPSNGSIAYNYSHYGDGSTTVVDTAKYWSRMYHYRNAYMICTILPALNDAAIYYKQHNCNSSDMVNMNQTWNYFVEQDKNRKYLKKSKR